MIGVICLLSSGGCAAPDVTQSGSGPDALEADFGGPSGLMEFLSSSDDALIRDTLEQYGLGYVAHPVSDGEEKNIADCPRYFPSGDRNRYHRFDGEHYYVDGSGRPQRAYKYLPPVAAAPRWESCQGNVGRWGDAENPSNNYDGGHLIGAQLGGWGGRANLAPQDANFNQGNWVRVENQMALCRSLESQRMFYQVVLSYPNASTLIPSGWRLNLEDRFQGDSVSVSFSNTDGGGSRGAVERDHAIDFLRASGCR